MIKDNNLSFEKYLTLKKSNELNKLKLHKESVHQSMCRYALVDNLTNTFDWQYWTVITFGYFPQKSVLEQILSNAHYRFDRWLMTNNKLEYLSVAQRSKWVCLPEKGDNGHLHYNCFMNLNLFPDAKTYGTEWNSLRIALKQTLKNLESVYNVRPIDFKIFERKKCKKDTLQRAIYSTKEMRQKWIDEHYGQDHFADFIRSWKDWQIKPITKRSPVKLKYEERPSITLEQFMM